MALGQVAAASPSPLVRVSQLARYWEKNALTVLAWIRAGRLPALRSPGGHYRVRVADVRAFCEREGLPVPPFVARPAPRVVLGVSTRGLKLPGAEIDARDDPYEALLHAVAEHAAVLVLPATVDGFDAEQATRAVRRTASHGPPAVVIVGVSGRKQAERLTHAGAAHVLPSARSGPLGEALREVLGALTP